MAKVQNGEEILPKVSTPGVGRTNVTDDRRICDSKDPRTAMLLATFLLTYFVPRGIDRICKHKATAEIESLKMNPIAAHVFVKNRYGPAELEIN